MLEKYVFLLRSKFCQTDTLVEIGADILLLVSVSWATSDSTLVLLFLLTTMRVPFLLVDGKYPVPLSKDSIFLCCDSILSCAPSYRINSLVHWLYAQDLNKDLLYV